MPSVEPDAGLISLRWPEPKSRVRCSTDWAIQVPLDEEIFKVNKTLSKLYSHVFDKQICTLHIYKSFSAKHWFSHPFLGQTFSVSSCTAGRHWCLWKLSHFMITHWFLWPYTNVISIYLIRFHLRIKMFLTRNTLNRQTLGIRDQYPYIIIWGVQHKNTRLLNTRVHWKTDILKIFERKKISKELKRTFQAKFCFLIDYELQMICFVLKV